MVKISDLADMLRHVTIEYHSGMTVMYEGDALKEWATKYFVGQQAAATLQILEAQAQAPQTQEPVEQPSNVRSLREVLRRDE